MNSIKAIAIYNKKNNLTTHTYDGKYWMFSYDYGFLNVSEDEKNIIGTRCGLIPYSELRVDEYSKYKTKKITMEELIFKKYGISTCLIYYNIDNYKYYCNLIYKDWFGDDFILIH
jgi:hypothetical protein